MKIDLTELVQRVGNEADLEKEEKVSYPADELKLTQPVKIKLHLTNTGNSILVKGTVETEAELACSRCLKNYRLPLKAVIDEKFALSPPEYKKGRELELHEEDFVYPLEKDNSLDLSEVIRQNLLLALPMKTLCKADCKGI